MIITLFRCLSLYFTKYNAFKTKYFLLLSILATVSFTVQAQKKIQQIVYKDTIRQLSEVVVTASRTPESVLKSPISIALLDNKTIQNAAAPSFYDAIENIKGVQLLTSSLGFKVYNTRGFANPTNVRFVQLVDGVDNQAPHIGSPIASALAPTDLDVDHVEMLHGAASALYGMNALNGLVNIFSKNPFEYQGLSFQQKTGVNHFNDSNASVHIFSESSIRWAKVFNNIFATKINFEYLTGYDWISDNNSDLNPNGNASLNLFGNDNPAYDGINGYGNESSNRRNLTLGGKRYSVARTGYMEKEIADFSLRNIKGDISLFVRPIKNWEIAYTYRFGVLDNLYQRTNRFRLNDYSIDQHSISLKSPSIQAKIYMTHENTGQSYNIRSMAENIDRSFKGDDAWFTDFTNQFNASTNTGKSVTEALQLARSQADKGRPQPHTADFDALIKKLGDINNWDIGAALRVQSWLYHAEAQADLTQQLLSNLREKWGLNILTGVDYRTFEVVPDGNYFINPTKPDQNLTYDKVGGFVQLTKLFLNDKLKFNGALRADKNQYFDLRWNPRVALVYSPTGDQNIRISYQNAYRFPSLFEAFSNVNSGGVKRVGGLPIMSQGIFENSYFKTSIDAFQTAITNDVNKNGFTTAQAVVKNKGLLKKNDYGYIQPESVNSFEIGYKGQWFDKRLYVDIDFYYNQYQNFMAQVETNLPLTASANPDSIAFALNDRTKNQRYRLWTNSKTTVFNYGGSIGLSYRVYKTFMLSGNASYAQLDHKTTNDGLEEAFNTPRWIMNVSLSNRKITERLGFNINLKWQEEFLWQSSLATGNVPAYSTLDGQLTYALPAQNLTLKLGGTNLLNNYYYNFLAGPSVGGFYYLSATFNL
ncbi:TonB-dependent receptor [Arcicella aquatica]|uniref:TonB-dependent receptor n=1 Tax=Arcicella aquatica TaxID=217141 RepID=A0ABU5QJU3_9BACT|nr:TonB-dependent receptor [Arcicella aquatica]MEA5256731.1 TonB-dependent receptor [Arcicella aquatica]